MMTEQAHSTLQAESGLEVPRLRSGEKLTRREFERRYAATPDMHAELINGEVFIMSSPVFSAHAAAHAAIITWLGVYCAFHPTWRLYDNVSLRLDDQNEVQPDALLHHHNPQVGQVGWGNSNSYLEGIPHLIVEIAASSEPYDTHKKKDLYCRKGVAEYIVWQVQQQQIGWFFLQTGVYHSLQADKQGIIHSKTLPDLQLAVPALLAGDMAQVLKVVQQTTGPA